jgi:hypothetical protein
MTTTTDLPQPKFARKFVRAAATRGAGRSHRASPPPPRRP